MSWHDWVDIRTFLFSFGDIAVIGLIMWLTNRRKANDISRAKGRDVR
jgi:hypothetical protein